MATKIDLKVTVASATKKADRTFTYVNPEATDADLIRVAKAIAGLMNMQYSSAAKVTTVDLVEGVNDG